MVRVCQWLRSARASYTSFSRLETPERTKIKITRTSFNVYWSSFGALERQRWRIQMKLQMRIHIYDNEKYKAKTFNIEEWRRGGQGERERERGRGKTHSNAGSRELAKCFCHRRILWIRIWCVVRADHAATTKQNSVCMQSSTGHSRTRIQAKMQKKNTPANGIWMEKKNLKNLNDNIWDSCAVGKCNTYLCFGSGFGTGKFNKMKGRMGYIWYMRIFLHFLCRFTDIRAEILSAKNRPFVVMLVERRPMGQANYPNGARSPISSGSSNANKNNGTMDEDERLPFGHAMMPSTTMENWLFHHSPLLCEPRAAPCTHSLPAFASCKIRCAIIKWGDSFYGCHACVRVY